MASGVFTLRQQELALQQGAWTNQKTPTVNYLVVAGGGSGGGAASGQGNGGGGGAGGLLQGSFLVPWDSAITVTVGAGGAAITANTTPAGNNGNNSVFGPFTAVGGGGGGGSGSNAVAVGLNGGSGGGAGRRDADRWGGQGIAGQGNAGGSSKIAAPYYGCGGGGGAGTVGLNGLGGTGGNGGAGIASDISGVRTVYAGGGGGSAYSGSVTEAGIGGAGGGGAGAYAASPNATSGTANTGGGGGGAGLTAGGNGSASGAGGSGIVIISYPDIYAAPTATTGSPTVSTSGSGAISFNGSSQYLQYADNAAFTMGSGDFTIEAWVYRTATGRMGLIAQANSGGSDSSISFVIEVNTSNQLRGSVVSGTTYYDAVASTSFANNTWVHVAFVRDGNTTRLYSGGTQVATANVTGVTINDSSNRLGIGSFGEFVASLLWTGYVTNLRIVKGTCLYPNGTAFTPSTTPLTAISGTSILLPAMSGAFSADASTNAFFPAAFGDATFPTWVSSSPFTVTGYKNRVYTWTSSGSITF